MNNWYEQNCVQISQIKCSQISFPKSRKHWSEQNSTWIQLKQSFFASITCGKTKSKKRLQTKLRRVKWMKYCWNPHQNPEHTDRSKILDGSQWNKVISLPEYVVKQIMSNFSKQNCVVISEIKYSRASSPKSRNHWSEKSILWIPVKPSFFASIICFKTKYEKCLQTELLRDKWNWVFLKILTKIWKTLIGAK